jgi:hypothetical protein
VPLKNCAEANRTPPFGVPLEDMLLAGMQDCKPDLAEGAQAEPLFFCTVYRKKVDQFFASLMDQFFSKLRQSAPFHQR